MIEDAQGHRLSGATAAAAATYDRAVRAFNLVHGDSVGLFEEAREMAPDFAMATLGKAWVFAIANDPGFMAKAASLVDPFMFQDYYRERAPEQLAKEFGPRFAIAVATLSPGSWQGPVESGLGWHLVFVDTVVPGRVPAFEEVEADVKTAWLAEQKALAWQKAYQDMRAKYTVLVPVPAGVAANAQFVSPATAPVPAKPAP